MNRELTPIERTASEAEGQIIGALMNFGPSAARAVENLSAADFSTATRGAVFEAARELAIRNDSEPTPLQVHRHLKGRLSDGLFPSLPSLMDIQTKNVTQAPLPRWVQDVKAGRQYREATEFSTRLTTILERGESVQAITDEVAAYHAMAAESAPVKNTFTAGEGGKLLQDYLNNLRTGGRKDIIPTCLKWLDKPLKGGFQKKRLYILASRPALGKSILALQIAFNVAQSFAVLYFSLEMDIREQIVRLISSMAQINTFKIDRGFLSPSELSMVRDCAEALQAVDLEFNTARGVTIAGIISAIQAFSAGRSPESKPLGLVVIDTLGCIAKDNPRQTEYELYTRVSSTLKTIAQNQDIPVLLLHHVNRSQEARAKSEAEPRLSDLRGAGTLEQDADCVIFLHRECQPQDEKGQEAKRRTLIIAKNRAGETDKADLDLFGNFAQFTEAGGCPRAPGDVWAVPPSDEIDAEEQDAFF